MAKRKSTMSVLVNIIVLVLIVVLIGAAIYWFTDFLDDSENAFSLTIGGQKITSNASGFTILSGDSVIVSATEYSIDIYAKEVSEDFSFMVDEEVYSWNDDVVGKKFNKAFSIAFNGDTFTVSYLDLSKVLVDYFTSSDLDYSITMTDFPIGVDLFYMTVVSKSDNITISFGINYVFVEGITLDVDTIIF